MQLVSDILIDKLIIILFVFTLSTSGWAQSVDFKKKNFIDQKEDFKQARKALSEGNEFFNKGKDHCYKLSEYLKTEMDEYCFQSREHYEKALPHFLTANNFNPNNAELNFKIGICYLFSSTKNLSLSYFKRALELDKLVHPKIRYLIAMAYLYGEEYDNAMASFRDYILNLDPKNKATEKKIAEKRIEECKTAVSLSRLPQRVFVDNLGAEINSTLPEYKALITSNDSFLIYTARRNSAYVTEKDPFDNLYFENIYISEKKNDKWTSPEELFPDKRKGHIASLYITDDQSKILLYDGDKGNGDIMISTKKKGKWKKPKPFPGKVNSKFHESSACMSLNGDSLFFVSNRKKGTGGRDIYLCVYNSESEKWGDPQNLGKVINTEYDEEGVFIDKYGTLYFSSNGHKTMGGFDIFKTSYVHGTWTKPENLGYPINSVFDDLFYSENKDGTIAFISSDRKNSLGEKDVFLVEYMGEEKPVMLISEIESAFKDLDPIDNTMLIKSLQLNIHLKGTISDEKTNEPVIAKIELLYNNTEKILNEITSNNEDGSYSIIISSGINYSLVVTAEGYLAHSEFFSISDSVNYFEIFRNIKLKKAEVGTKIVLENIFFDFNKATIKPESYPELDKLAQVLNNSPGLKIEISGHTDNKGSEKYNQKLSESRAKAVVEYLINEKQVDKSLISYKGYGETQPVASNDTEEGRQQNRRTEFKILKVMNE